MTLWKRLKDLSPGALWQLFLLLLSRPLLIVPTIKATRKTFSITNRLYGKAQQGSGRANAFRHACWNALLTLHCHGAGLDPQKSAAWAKKVTDLHENLVVNHELDRQMDLHNNAVGRTIALGTLGQNDAVLIEKLKEMAKNAQKTTIIKKMELYKDQLIYIEEPTQ